METITNRIIRNFPNVTLYIEDVREIIEIFSSECTGVEIRAGDYQITTIDELDLLAEKFPSGRFPDLKIQGLTPFLSIEFSGRGMKAYVSEQSTQQLGIIGRCREVFAGCRGRWWVNLSFAVPWILGAMVGYALSFSANSIVGISLLTSLILTYPTISYITNNSVIVYTKSKSQCPTFFQRNLDSIITGIISAIVGGLIVALIIPGGSK